MNNTEHPEGQGEASFSGQSVARELQADQAIDGAAINPWDAMAEHRAEVLKNGLDRSYEDLCLQVTDSITEAVARGSKVLDVGCGVGYLTKKLTDSGYSVVGADIAPGSIEVGRRVFGLDAVVGGPQEAVEHNHGEPFDAVVANMVAHCVKDLETFYSDAAAALKPGGLLFVTVPDQMWAQNHADSLAVQGNWSDDQFTHTTVAREFAASGAHYQSQVTYYLRNPAAYLHYAASYFEAEAPASLATPLDRESYDLGESERASNSEDARDALGDIMLFKFRKKNDA
ncbi:MAG TPA: class I SAM-dependent methyltransferase [Candidatus Saccharimonadia bacterium]|nr:class I SAM-dependent methyltransferase [Candidatus Saccharimonadia bacterium]